MKENINLFIDESGIGNITHFKYRYFLMSSVIMSESEDAKAHSFFSCWKRKYIVKDDKNFHTTDFFEDNYKKKKLIICRKKSLNKFPNFKT